MDNTTDPMPRSAEGQRKDYQKSVRKSNDLTSNADGPKSGIGISTCKSAWLTKGRKSQIKNLKPSWCKTNLLVMEGYSWDSATS